MVPTILHFLHLIFPLSSVLSDINIVTLDSHLAVITDLTLSLILILVDHYVLIVKKKKKHST